MAKKCLECNGCTQIVWIMPRRFFHCDFCGIWYDIVDNKLVRIDVGENNIETSNSILDKVSKRDNDSQT